MGISSDAEHFGGQFKVIRGQPRSNSYSLSYGNETLWVAISSDANNFGGQFKVIRGHQRSNDLPMLYGREKTPCREGVIQGQMGSNQYSLSFRSETWWMPTILEVSSRSSGVTQGQICIVCCMEAKLGGWGRRPMLTILEVSSRS